MRLAICEINGVPISDSDVEHIQCSGQLRRTLPGAPDNETERLQAEALGLGVEQFRRLNASLDALRH
ncbi:hypothetical protein GCM10022631_15030 [Deinococcus rubellus]|uniref:Uncharacterized protein n=1 Tax=Deinococcus rubellus TaxID=1889240 RepID=A0ABY5YKW4_9DEIO|nr:hypothetical protein [Deinococcus rubellus]UWX64899.1 hypothetical protein N0D28_04350 [Deinococcus rubellus]